MSTRKVKIIPKNLFDLQVILEELGSPKEVIIEVPDTKETMGYLCSSKLIDDWDFLEDKKDDPQVKDYDELARYLEDTYRIYKVSPAIKFGSSLFNEAREKLDKSSFPVDHVLIKMILESRYSGWDWEDVNEDFMDSLNKVWLSKKIDGCNTLVDFVKLIYENSGK